MLVLEVPEEHYQVMEVREDYHMLQYHPQQPQQMSLYLQVMLLLVVEMGEQVVLQVQGVLPEQCLQLLMVFYLN